MVWDIFTEFHNVTDTERQEVILAWSDFWQKSEYVGLAEVCTM